MRREPMRIAILLPNLGGGGGERNSLTIASGLLRRGYEVDLVLKRFVCDYPEELPPGARLFYLDPGGDERSATGREPLPVAPEPLFRDQYSSGCVTRGSPSPPGCPGASYRSSRSSTTRCDGRRRPRLTSIASVLTRFSP